MKLSNFKTAAVGMGRGWGCRRRDRARPFMWFYSTLKWLPEASVRKLLMTCYWLGVRVCVL